MNSQPRSDVPGITLDAGALSRCRHRIWMDHSGLAAPIALPNTSVIQRQQDAVAHREYVRDMLAERHPDGWVTIDPTVTYRERVALTLDAAQSGASFIWGAALPVDVESGRRGSVELLIRRDAGYLPVIVVNHKVTDPGSGARTSPIDRWAPALDQHRKVRRQSRDQLRLAHIYRLLDAAGLADGGGEAGSIGFGADCVLVHDVRSYLGNYDERFADRLDVARGDARSEPVRIGECAVCPWWSHCRDELLGRRDVTLVIPGSKGADLLAAGITTIDALADWSGPPPPEVTWPADQFADSRVLAKAWRAEVTLVRRHPEITVPRADIEVDIDMESYQEFGAYLWGTLLSTAERPDGDYRGFVTWDAVPTADEGRMFAEFWAWLSRVRRAAASNGHSFAAYCYSRSAENRWLLSTATRFAGTPGVPSVAEITEFIESPEWVDMYEQAALHFISPAGMGLKKIAPHAGFGWRDAEASGEASMAWYRTAVGLDEPMPDGPTAEAVAQRDRLLEYNEDDVRATKVLRDWMSTRAVDEVFHTEDL